MLIYQRMKHFSKELKELVIAEKELKRQESELLVKLEQSNDPSNIPYEIFVPDHLGFGCKTGSLFCPMSAPPLQSYLMLPIYEY